MSPTSSGGSRPYARTWKFRGTHLETCVVASPGRIDYLRAWRLQRELHARVVEGALPNLLLLLEHPHVYTLGRRASTSDILVDSETLSELGVEVHHVDRGGEVTYHGPGQLVGYPIVDLRSWGGGPLRYVRALEKVIVATVAELGVAAHTGERPTGVWVGDSKIAAIGVKVSRGVTMHGFALNVDPDLSLFDHIVPCGTPGGQVTSLRSERPGVADVSSVIPVLARQFGGVFNWAMEWRSLRDPLSPDAARVLAGKEMAGAKFRAP